MIILEQPLTESKEEDGIAVTKEMTSVHSYSSQIIRPGKGFKTPLVKSSCPTSPLKLLVEPDDDYRSHARSQCKGKENSVVSTTADVGTKQILKSAEGMVAKRPSSAGPTSHKGSGDHKESLYSFKLKGIEGSAVSIVSSVYTPCFISLGTEQSQHKTDKEFNTITTHVKINASDRNRVQDTMREHYLQDPPLKPLSLHRNTSPLDNKFEHRNVYQISSIPLSSEEGCLQKSATQQQSQSFSVSSDKIHERQRTRSFTGQMEQARGKREHAFSLIKSSSNLKTQDLHKNAQVRAMGKDPSQTGATSSPATKPRDLTITVSTGQERGDSPANKARDVAVDTQERVDEAEEANKGLEMNKVSKKQKEERNASEVKLHTTAQSDVNVKQHNTEVRSIAWLSESTTPIAIGQNNSKMGPVRETSPVLRSSPLYNTELFISAETPVFSSIRSQSARRDEERAGLIRFPGKSLFLIYKTPFRHI